MIKIKSLDAVLLITCLLFLTNYVFANTSLNREINLSPYLEILDSEWNSKNIDQISNVQIWLTAYSELGKSKITYQGNWYRLQIGNWLQNGNWVLVHPLAAQFTFYRKING